MGGGERVLLGLYTPGLACKVQHKPLYRFIATCFARVAEEIVDSCIYSCFAVSFTITINPVEGYHPPLG